MLLTVDIATDKAKARAMLLDTLKDGRARTAMKKMLVSQGVESKLAETLCSPPPQGCEDPIDYYLEVMERKANGKTPIKAPRSGAFLLC